jgi:hypothetical protein
VLFRWEGAKQRADDETLAVLARLFCFTIECICVLESGVVGKEEGGLDNAMILPFLTIS